MKLTRVDLLLVLAAFLATLNLGLGSLPSPVLYSNIPFPVAPTRVAAGEVIAMTIARCNDWPITLTYAVSWGMVRSDNLRIDLPDSFITAAPGCQSGDARNQIPFGTPPGEYRIGRVATVHTPLGTTYSVPSESVPFTVTP